MIGNKRGKHSLQFFKWIRNCICQDQRNWHCNALKNTNFNCVQGQGHSDLRDLNQLIHQLLPQETTLPHSSLPLYQIQNKLSFSLFHKVNPNYCTVPRLLGLMQKRQQKHAAGSWMHSKVKLRIWRNVTLGTQKEFAECKSNRGKKREGQGKSPLELHRRLADDFQLA